jgi:hypothetical protein
MYVFLSTVILIQPDSILIVIPERCDYLEARFFFSAKCCPGDSASTCNFPGIEKQWLLTPGNTCDKVAWGTWLDRLRFPS